MQNSASSVFDSRRPAAWRRPVHNRNQIKDTPPHQSAHAVSATLVALTLHVPGLLAGNTISIGSATAVCTATARLGAGFVFLRTFACDPCLATEGSFQKIPLHHQLPNFGMQLVNLGLHISSTTVILAKSRALKSFEYRFFFVISDRPFHRQIHLNNWPEFPRPPLF